MTRTTSTIARRGICSPISARWDCWSSILLLIRCPQSFKPRVRSAFWAYITAIAIQSFTYGIQFIIFATVGAAVYMFLVIIADQTEQYEAQRVESSRLETELSMATRIQADMLPNIFPAFPERKESDIYASMNPAKEVGGDFYDFFLIDDDHLGLVIADVSGKGVPAALFMMASKILVQNYAIMDKSPKAALEAANYQICQSNREDMFVTVWLGILDLRTGMLTASNAGHELFGTDRMIQALNKDPGAAPDQVLQNVTEGVHAFVAGAEQFDDITMLCLQYNGPEPD